ncbi:DUF4214 domain-containing protein [Sulfitobacter sp. JBTF-M27]|uniref:DUF4214 domain-containing protein n=1 Tax=Sulfitobacter sediminilitoris TaxID=2698830 RepID=A0A6P0CFU7_9RHOB|nr:DUF4214 domain-containing protein [Sulfitobacter sediminilitoris]NEK24797.1 DUF4214 domain-containing protein [Sulfitobacter sediminilitoris]
MTNNAPKGPVTILGYAYVGETVLARPNGVADADGINYDTVRLQWLRDGKEILGATSQEYTVTLADEGTQISVRYSYTDYGGTREVVTSDPEPAVPPAGTPIPDSEASYSPLIILGDAVVGEYLLARPNAITDENGIDYASTSFQWLRDGKAIPGATSERYDVTDADIGAEISVQYFYRDLLGKSKSVTSNPKPEVPNPDGLAPAPTVPTDDGGTGDVPVSDVPTDDGSTGDVPVADNDSNALVIIGDAIVGKYLIAGVSGVTDPNGINSAYVSYQWLRDGKAISGATSQKYTVTETDIGAEISVQYSYRDLRGTTKSLTSNPTSEVPAPDGVMRVPNVTTDEGGTGDVSDTEENSSQLTIFGDALVGEYLFARSTDITDKNGIDKGSASFQWLRDGALIPGATSQLYEITEADIGAEISVLYVYRDLLGISKSLSSDPKPEVPDPDGEAPARFALGGPGDASETVGEVVLEGTPAAEILTAVAGLQQINGGDGVDTVVFAGAQTHYTVSFSADGVTVTDRTEGGLGTIALDHVELIDFDTDLEVFGGPMGLGQFGGHTGLDAEAFEELIGVYIAYFNRAPDAIGLSFWATEFANGMSLEQISSLFADQDETEAAYPETSSNAYFATIVYNNVLGRIPDQEGFDFWVNTLDAGAITRDQFILAVLEGAKANPPAGASQDFIDQQQADRAYLETKIDIGAYFAVHKGMSDVADAAQVMALFDGSESSISNALAAIEGDYEDAVSPDGGDFLMPLIGVLDNPLIG